MTKDEIIQAIATKLEKGQRQQGTWADVVTGVQLLSPAERTEFVSLIKAGERTKVGDVLVESYKKQIRLKAVAEAEILLADDRLSVTELEKIL